MQTVKASTILDDAYRLIGWDAGQIDSRDKADARCALSKAIQEVWDRWWWNELMICQQRQNSSFVTLLYIRLRACSLPLWVKYSS